ncbi:MAG: hypothetical protein ACKOLA_07235, partial [Spartobacteria bacterium]
WVEKLFAFSQDERPQSAAEALLNLDRPANKPSPAKRHDTSGKPSFATQPPAKKSKPEPPADSAPSAAKDKIPFYRSQNFVIAMVAVIAVCATISILALTGNFGGGGARSSPIAKKEKPTPTPAERTAFKFTERGEIKDMAGKQITVTGGIDRLEFDDKGRYLVFKDSDPRDVMVFFDKQKTETSEWMLKRKFAGQIVKATGTVKLDGNRLLLELNSMDDLKLHAD